MIDALHIDLNSAMFRPETIRAMLRAAAAAGKNAVLWEVEDKVRWDSCPDVPHPDAMSKDDFRALLAESRALGLEPIPLLQTFGHAEYVLLKDRRKAMRELPEFQDCYCTSNPDVRAFLRAFAAEYREVFGPLRFFHFGGDEAYRFGSCPVCSKRDRFELYAEHLLDVTAETRAAGIRVLIWDDMVRHDPARLAAALPPREVALCHWEYGPWPAGPDAFAPSTDFSKAAELAAHGFDVAVCGAASSWGDDPFLPRFARHAPNLVSARAAGAALLGSVDTSWTVRLVPKRLQLPLFAADPAAALARELPGLAPDAALSALRRVSQWEADWQHFLGIGWNGCKDSSLPPPDLFAQRAAERPAFLARLRTDAAALRAAVEGAAAEIAAAHPGAAPDSFAGTLLEGAALKRGLVRALEGAAGAGPALPAEELAGLRARSEAYYAREMTPSSAARAAAIVWGGFERCAPMKNPIESEP
jgi:hypothetical protein